MAGAALSAGLFLKYRRPGLTLMRGMDCGDSGMVSENNLEMAINEVWSSSGARGSVW